MQVTFDNASMRTPKRKPFHQLIIHANIKLCSAVNVSYGFNKMKSESKRNETCDCYCPHISAHLLHGI